MNFRQLYKALQEINKHPKLLEQKVTFQSMDLNIDIILVNVYGDDRITFIQDYETGVSDDSTLDASENNQATSRETGLE